MSQTKAQLLLPFGTFTAGNGIDVTGVVTATQFVGDGSGLTGVVGSGSGVIIEDDGVLRGTAGTINFGSNIDVTPLVGGEVTVSVFSPENVGYWNINASGINTSSSVGIGSTLPSVPLDVVGNIKSTATISAQDFNSTSDVTLKYNINTIENALDKISEIRGVEFDWVNETGSSMGVIAQEVEEVFPKIVTSTSPRQVNYNGLIGILIEAVKELKEENRVLKLQVEEINERLREN
jgi:hypothetical protein